MKILTGLRPFRSWSALFLFALPVVQHAPRAEAQGYQVGQVVTNNFSLMTRLQWTNDNGEVFTPTNTALRLSDFNGKILLLEFFAVW